MTASQDGRTSPTGAALSTLRPPWQMPALLFAIALALRLFSWERTAVMFNDGPRFLRQAQAIGEGRFGAALAEPYHPLYAIATASLSALGLNLETAAAVISVVAGSAAVVLLYSFLRDAFGAPYDWLGAFLFATHSRAVQYSSDIQSEGLFFFTFLAALGLAWRALDRGAAGYAAAAGLAAACAYWTRPEGLVVVVSAAVVSPLWAWRRGWGVSRYARWTASLAIAVLLGVAPFVVATHAATGQWGLTQKKPLLTQSSEVSTARAVSAAPTGGAPAIGDAPPLRVARPPHPPKALQPALGELWYTWRSSARPLLLGALALALVGWGRPGLRGAWLGVLVAIYLGILLWLLMSAGYVSRRHTLPSLLPLFGYAAMGLCLAWNALIRRFPRPGLWRKATPAALAAILLLPVEIQPRRIDKLAERNAAEWLAHHPVESPDESVAGVGGRVGYYARRPMLDVRNVNAEGLAPLLNSEGVRFAILDNPTLIRVLEDSTEFVAIHRVDAAGVRAQVFEQRTETSE